jgi:hypothetical protein
MTLLAGIADPWAGAGFICRIGAGIVWSIRWWLGPTSPDSDPAGGAGAPIRAAATAVAGLLPSPPPRALDGGGGLLSARSAVGWLRVSTVRAQAAMVPAGGVERLMP